MKSFSFFMLFFFLAFSWLYASQETPWEPWRPAMKGYEVTDTEIESFSNLPQSQQSNSLDPKDSSEKEKPTEAVGAFHGDALSVKENSPSNDVKPFFSDGSYRLKIGDSLRISIYGELDSTRTVIVDATGSIHYLYVDSLFVLGKTIAELRQMLNERLKKEFKHVLACVTALRLGGEHYTILGEVAEPGQKVLYGKETLLMAIGKAKGVTRGTFRNQLVDFADLKRAFLSRNGEYIPIDFVRLVHEGDLSQNIELKSGDYIYIPPILAKEVFILGEVNQPSTFVHLGSVSLVEAIAEAQGLTINADCRIIVLRGSLSCPIHYEVNIERILRGCEPDFMLQPGDIVYAPSKCFFTLKEMIKDALRIFVSTIASIGGSNTYLDITPSARANSVIPVNVISTNVPTQTVVVPVTP